MYYILYIVTVFLRIQKCFKIVTKNVSMHCFVTFLILFFLKFDVLKKTMLLVHIEYCLLYIIYYML